MKKQFDEIQKAAHYNQHPSGVECITVVRHHSFNIGNVIKYLWRAGLKDASLKDLKKARYYLDDEIKMIEEAQQIGYENILKEVCAKAVAKKKPLFVINKKAFLRK
jgi:hypothetical protein